MRLKDAAAALLLLAGVAAGHEGEVHAVTPQNALTAWNWDPLVLSALVLSAALYAAGRRRMSRQRRASVTRLQAVSYWAGWSLLVVALVSPVHKIGAALFSVHMTQHEAMMLLAAPLLVMGRPLIVYLWGLPEKRREPVAHAFRGRAMAAAWKWVSAPVVVWALHAVALWMWHVPSLYEAAVRSEGVHAVQHSMFLLTALLFWWTLVHGRYGRMGYGMAVLYVFTTSVHSGALGAMFTLGERVWFDVHVGRTAAWNLTPLEDQQLAGLLMWVPAGVIFIVVGLALFAAWLGESERRLQYARLGDESLKDAAGTERSV